MATDLSPQQQQARDLYESGKTQREVADEMGLSRARVVTVLKEAGVEFRPVGRRPKAAAEGK